MKKYLSVILAIIIAFSMVTCSGMTSFAADLSGSCGEGVTWEYTQDDKTLTISGDNLMDNYTYDGASYNRPWESFATEIEYVVINSGVLSVGDYAFAGLSNLKEITISETVLIIGEGAFESCTTLDFANIGEYVMAIGPSAFKNCSLLSLIKICKETVYIGDNAFEGCPDISVIYTGLKPQLDYIYYEDASEKFKNVRCADTVYDFVVDVDYYDVFTAVSEQPFQFAMKTNDNAEILEAQYEVVSEGGVDYCVGGVAIFGKQNGSVVLYAVDNDGNVLDTFTVLVGCVNGHSFTDEGTGKKATCTELGYDVMLCGYCPHSETVNYHYGEHKVDSYETVKDATCEEAGLEKGQCTVCEEWFEKEIPVGGHNWTDWVVTLEPTEEEEGKKEHECTVCGEKETEFIPKLSNVLGDVNGDGEVSSIDARWVLQCVAELRELDEHSLKLADVNGDGKLSAVDARWILQCVAGLREFDANTVNPN